MSHDGIRTATCFSPDRERRQYYAAKRALDVLLAGGALIVLWPLMLLIAALIRADSDGPALFFHRRIGRDGVPFLMWKFRTMHANAEAMLEAFTPEQRAEWARNFKLKDDPRITKIGKILRRTSLDELPQLVNILRGEMSIVGPRPIVEAELERYGNRAEMLLSAPPGLTGHWQAHARSSCSYQQRMEMELDYVRNASLSWDLRIMRDTVKAVIKGDGAQ